MGPKMGSQKWLKWVVGIIGIGVEHTFWPFLSIFGHFCHFWDFCDIYIENMCILFTLFILLICVFYVLFVKLHCTNRGIFCCFLSFCVIFVKIDIKWGQNWMIHFWDPYIRRLIGFFDQNGVLKDWPKIHTSERRFAFLRFSGFL